MNQNNADAENQNNSQTNAVSDPLPLGFSRADPDIVFDAIMDLVNAESSLRSAYRALGRAGVPQNAPLRQKIDNRADHVRRTLDDLEDAYDEIDSNRVIED